MENTYKNKYLSLNKLIKTYFTAIILTIIATSSTFAEATNFSNKLKRYTVTLNLQNQTLYDILTEIQKQTGYGIVYQGGILSKEIENLSVKVANKNVVEVLNNLLMNTPYDYSIEKNTITINRKEVVEEIQVSQKNIKITGKIVDAKSLKPIPGALIAVTDGSGRGAISDIDGIFIIELKIGTEIEISFVGMKSKRHKITENDINITFPMNPDTIELDDIVVIGFKNANKETFTGSSVKVHADDIAVAGISDASRMLEGRVAGVSVQNVSSTFGSAPKIRVRGVTSLSGENKPLWVVDGVVLEDMVNISNDQLSSGDPTTLLGSSVAGINVADIETFDILKDAAATSLYGARAMNGVVIITTKKGKQGKPRVSYSGNFTVRDKPKYSNYDIMNSVDQMGVYSELEQKGLLNQDIVNAPNSGIYGSMYNAINNYNPDTGKFMLENTRDARNRFLMDYAKANTDWFNALFTYNLLQEHSLSVSTGSERSRTYASVGLLNDAGWSKSEKVARYTFNFRNDYDITKKVTVGMQAVASIRQQEAPGSYERKVDAISGNWTRDFDINPFSYSLNTSRTLRPYNNQGDLDYVTMNYAPFNILNELDNNKIDLNVIDAKFQATLDYKINKYFSFNGIGMFRYVKSDQVHMITENSNVSGAYRADYNSTIRERNNYLWRDKDNIDAEPISVLEKGGFYNTSNNMMINYEARASFAYIRDWGLHSLNAIAGTQVKYLERTYHDAIQAGYQYNMGGVVYASPNFHKMMSDRQLDLFSSTIGRDRFAAFYANADYSFDRRFSVSGTVRYDGSNALGSQANARWLPTWNIGGKWNLHREQFLENVDWINMLGVRASYGLNASMPPISNAAAVYGSSQIFRPGNIENVIEILTLANNELTWEKSYQFNAGLDLAMIGNRINLSFDYFNRKSFDLISTVKTSGIGGMQYKYANYADLDAHGFDLTIGGTIISSGDMSLSANFAFGYSKNVIVDSKDIPRITDLVRPEGGNVEGYAVNSLFSIPFSRIDSETGVPLYFDENGNETKNTNMQSSDIGYLKHEGSIDPTYSGGLNITFKYKRLTFNTFISYAGGNKIRLTPVYSESYSDLTAMPNEFNDRFMMTGDNISPSILDWVHQSISLGEGGFPYMNYNYSDQRVVNGGFVKLKSLSLNYDLSSKILNKSNIFKNAGIRFTVKDPWLIYADKDLNGQDPEFFNTGGVAMPSTTQYTLSLNIGF